MRISLPLLSTLWFFFVLIFTTPVFSQAPEAINYQAVFRDSIGPNKFPLLADTGVTFQVYIYDGPPSVGTVVYKEEHLELNR